jgi:aspartate kinase
VVAAGEEDTVQSERRRPIIVQKYGGSSVADVEKLGRVAERVVATHRAGHAVVVVVSAMGKTTDSLLALARSAAQTGGADAEPARRELDMLHTTGERVSTSLLSIAIQARGLPAISFTGSQSGILTNDRHFDARIIEVRPHRIEDELARGQIVIVAGYQGMSYRKEITTLGRGGSDTTAVALAAALAAERCEIYSDVDGVYSADPRAVPEARHLPELSYEMLQEMAEHGAKVVCAQAVEWARRQGIAIYARSTFDAPGQGRETIVRRFAPDQRTTARAVVCGAKMLQARASGHPPEALDDLVALLDRLELPFEDLVSEVAGASFVVPLVNVPSPDAAKAALREAGLALDDEVSTVSVVGDGLAAAGEPVLRFTRALRDAGASPSRLVAGPLRLGAVVPSARAVDAQRALHAAFVAPPVA